jgi:hypothetical protein
MHTFVSNDISLHKSGDAAYELTTKLVQQKHYEGTFYDMFSR